MNRLVVLYCLLATLLIFSSGCSSSPRSYSNNDEWETPYGCKFLSDYFSKARTSSKVNFDNIDIEALKRSSVAVVQSKDPLVFVHKGGSDGFYSFYVEEYPLDSKTRECKTPSGEIPDNFVVLGVSNIKATETRPANATKKQVNRLSMQVHSLTLLVHNDIALPLRTKLERSSPPTFVQDRIRNISYLLEEASYGDSQVSILCKTRSKVTDSLSQEIVDFTDIHLKCLAAKERYEKLAVLKEQRTTEDLIKREVPACAEDKAFAGLPELEL